MYELTLSVLIVSVLTIPATAQIKTCLLAWQTTDPDGKVDAAGATGTPCTLVRGQPAGDCMAGATSPTGDALCIFSVSQQGYRCCYTLKEAAFSTPAPGMILPTLAAGSTATPRNLKPKCPNGALSSVMSKSNQPATCNIASKTSTCPTGFTCTKAANVYDVYGTPTDPSDDLGAGLTPYLCCKATHLKSHTFVFIDANLSPQIVPTAPAAGINFVTLSNTAKSEVSLSDDFSYLPDLLKTAPASLTLFRPTIATRYYHVLFFDSSSPSKYCMFVGNIQGDGKTMITLPDISATNGAGVYNAGTETAPLYRFTATYQPPILSSVPHRFVVLVYETTAKLVFTAAQVKSATQINNNIGLYGDFEPGRYGISSGVFKDVAKLLKGKFNAILRTPIAGTYFFAKN
uniref:Uncharacterized protein n=1 Tax=Plectus sambesii TaxID=2011161 RepID=A0A914WLA4_9BILA